MHASFFVRECDYVIIVLAHYSHCLYLVLFATGEGRGKTTKRKTAKAIVSVFFSGSQGSHVWLAWFAWLARLARWLAGSHIGHTLVKYEFELLSTSSSC